MDDEVVEIGPRFEQQVGATHSIPDAVLSQKPLHICIEAKHGNGLYDEQLERHMRSIKEAKHPEGSAFLIGLTTDSAGRDNNDLWKEKAYEYGITFVSTTYRDMLDSLNPICADYPDLKEIFDDYQTFIGGENLLPDQYRTLAAMLCGTSWRENIAHGVYFEPDYRNAKWKRAHFMGIYRQKCISHVGRIVAAAICRTKNGELIVESEELNSLSDEHRDRIRSIIDAATYYPNLGDENLRYYLVDNFAETDIRKTSSGGMMGHRYFDIEKLAGTEPLQQKASSDEIATRLMGAMYE